LPSSCAIIAATMLLASLLSLNSYSQAVPSKNDKEKDTTCWISGMVVKLVDGAPLKGAMVRVEHGEDHEQQSQRRRERTVDSN
jgi:hypothetical protein